MNRRNDLRRERTNRVVFGFLCAGLLFSPSPATATVFDWDNFSGDSTFDTRINWNPFPNPPNVPGVGDTAVFDGLLAGSGVGNNAVNVSDGTAIEVMQVIDAAVVDMTIGDGTTSSRFDLNQIPGDSLVIGDSTGDTATLNLLGGRFDTFATTIGGQAIFNVINPGSLWDSTSVLVQGDSGLANTAAIGLGNQATIATHGTLDVGSNAGSGRVVVDGTVVGFGTPSRWTVDLSLDIGPSSTITSDFGHVTLQQGGQMNVGVDVDVHGTSDDVPPPSVLTVQTGGDLDVAGSLNIGPFGVLELFDSTSTITTGDIDNDGGTLDWTGGTLHITDGRLRIDDSVFADLEISSLTVDSGMTLKVTRVTPGSDSLTIGNIGTGQMTMHNGGTVESYHGFIGEASSADGTVNVTGVTSRWTVSEILGVGLKDSAVGRLNITDGQVSAKSIWLGQAGTADGTVTVDNGTLTSTAVLAVGGFIADDGVSGASAGGTGQLTVQNDGIVDVEKTLIVFGGGAVNLTGSSQLTADTIRLEPGATFTDVGNFLIRANSLIGFGNTPSFSGNLQLGHSGGSGSGSHTVGAGQTLTVNQFLTIGTDAPAALSIQGGTVNSDDSFIGGAVGSDGSSVEIRGSGASWFANRLNVGGDGIAPQAAAVLTVADDAQAIVSNGITIWRPGAVILDGGVISTPSVMVEGQLNGSGAIVLGSGPTSTTSVVNRGVVAPGLSAGVLSIDGTASTADAYVQDASGFLQLDIGGTSPAQYGRLDIVGGSAALDGFLDVVLVDPLGGSNLFVPKAGDSFEILTADGGLGGTTFATLPTALPVLTGALFWDIVYGSTFVRLDVLTPFTADFDGDGDVDSDDLAQWEGDFGGAGSDADGDGDSDGADFLAWQRQFGSGITPLAASQAVPEPASLWLLGIGCAGIATRRRR